MMKRYLILPSIFIFVLLLIFQAPAEAQQAQFTRQEVIALTPEWEGERYPDGRPKVPEGILQRMKKVTIEEAWAVLRGE
ncbi:hypothetical protein NC796_26020, partial [Aliifodinibius sp. S!AR15-10]